MEPNTIQEKLKQFNEEEEEEEALSLCDLPVTMTGDNSHKSRKLPDSPITEAQEFDFPAWGGLFAEGPEMCAADEVFFQGRILPLGCSLSTTRFQSHGQQFSRCKSESLYHVSLSNSSRSSSLGSDQYSSSHCCSTTTTISTRRIPEPTRAQDQFHTLPSPKPQLSITLPKQSIFSNQGRKISVWEFFRLGVVPASEIGMKMQKLMVRSSNSAIKNYAGRNSRSSRNTNTDCSAKSVKLSSSTDHSGNRKHFFKHFEGKGGALWRDCKCSVETMESNMIIIKGVPKIPNKIESTTEHALKEKVLQLKKQSSGQKQEKKTMSRRRTSEWIKELSDEHNPDEETLLFNA